MASSSTSTCVRQTDGPTIRSAATTPRRYSSVPDFDFARLRKEAPEKYESYVDLEAGAWTHYRVVVQGITARLFVHGAAQPALVVNDLKLGDISGGVALCIGPGTEGHFSGLKIEHEPRH